MSKPLNRLRNRLILLLFVFAVFFGLRLGAGVADSSATLLTYILGAGLTASICTIDADERGKPLSHAVKLILVLLWGVVGPIYAVFGRGMRQAGWGLGLVFSLYLTSGFSFVLGVASQTTSDTKVPLTMEYQGKAIELTPGDWADFDDFKHDEDKLDNRQADKIEDALVRAEIPLRPLTRSEMIDYTRDLVFPGFGTSSSATQQPDGSLVYLESIEIPLQGKDRKFIFHVVDEAYLLVDDFVWADESPPIREAHLDGDTIRYFSFDKVQVRESISLQVKRIDK